MGMKLKFEMPVWIEPIDEDKLCEEWQLGFSYDYDDGEIVFNFAHLKFEDELKFQDFLEEVGKKEDADFLANLFTLAEAHVEMNLDEALNDYYANS